MKYIIFIVIMALATLSWSNSEKYNIVIITGGHGFDEESFFEVFNSFDNITYEHVTQPNANELIASDKIERYDVLVFYDMYDSISDAQKQAYLNLLENGKGMVFLHHALVSYQDWQQFKNIIGGKYYRDSACVDGNLYKSTFKHDVSLRVIVEDTEHAIMNGITDFQIFDEVYGNCDILPSVHPLLSTDHPESMKYIAWINSFGNSEVIYIQPGHGPEGFQNKNFRKLLYQSILWSANRH